jgi:DNA (cytosine-5)-methyltransferase 1
MSRTPQPAASHTQAKPAAEARQIAACAPALAPLPVLSFFTGGGFLDIGFEKAGFTTAWSNEYNPLIADLHDHAYTSWRRSTDPRASEVKIRNRKSIRDVSASVILDEAFGGNPPALFGAVGGPPCTDFSKGGANAGGSGSAGRLTGVYVKRLRTLKPAFFVLENVPGLARHPGHLAYFKRKKAELEQDYWVHERILSALELGVPQDRDRLFLVGIRKNLDGLNRGFAWPEDTRYRGAKLLPWPREVKAGQVVVKPLEIPDALTVHYAFGSGRSLEYLPNGREWFKPYSSKFTEVPEGRVATKSFKRLHRYRYSPTAWYGNQEVHLHPTEARRLSVREALRLQSVPDTYALPENATLSAKFRLVCNGVPVQLAERVAQSVRSHLSLLGCI